MTHTCLGSPTSSFPAQECGPGETGGRWLQAGTSSCWLQSSRSAGAAVTLRLCHHPKCPPHQLGLGCVPSPGHLFMGLRFSYKVFFLRGTWNPTTGPSPAFPQPSALFRMVTMQCSTKQRTLLMHGVGSKSPSGAEETRPKHTQRSSNVQNLPRKTSSLMKGSGSAVSLGAGAEWDGALTPGSGPGCTHSCPAQEGAPGP